MTNINKEIQDQIILMSECLLDTNRGSDRLFDIMEMNYSAEDVNQLQQQMCNIDRTNREGPLKAIGTFFSDYQRDLLRTTEEYNNIANGI